MIPRGAVRAITAVLVPFLVLTGGPGSGDDDFMGDTTPTGAGVRASLAHAKLVLSMNGLQSVPGRDRPVAPVERPAPKTRIEYELVPNCGIAIPDQSRDLCPAAITACAGNTPEQGLGPQSVIFQRTWFSPTSAGPWFRVGLTCDPAGAAAQAVAAGATPPRPMWTMAMVDRAFRAIDFAKPVIAFQPRGNRTLVRLPNYYEVTWPRAGYGPGEVYTVPPAQMLGYTVRIRPKAQSYDYRFGDGTHTATASPGGPYPTGDVTHAYRHSGTVTTDVTAHYGADFSVDGSPWLPIPGTVTVPGPQQAVTVHEARSELVDAP